MINKSHIQNSFGKASATYDQEAPVQKWTAALVADHVKNCVLPNNFKGLEIGCGTGFLTEHMLAQNIESEWFITDLSQEMLESCKDRVGERACFQVMDGEYPDVAQKFDLIVSSLAVQWFDCLQDGLNRLCDLLKPGGHLVFSTLGQKSFCEWRKTLEDLHVPVGLHTYQTIEEMRAVAFKGCTTKFTSYIKKQPYDDGLSFLRALKLIGAHAPRADYKPMGPLMMRNALTHLEEYTDCSMTYEIIIGHITRCEDR
ncbi:MAG: methyltransferase [Methylocystaceae bacterium]|nr:methyltransferase [Methylocystaceae bacterium]